MALILNLTPEVEAHLHEMASQHGQKPEEYTLSLLDEWVRQDEREFTEAVSAIREGLADLEAGDRGMLLEDYRSQLEEQYRREDAARSPIGSA